MGPLLRVPRWPRLGAALGVAALIALVMPLGAAAATILVNNGLAPPDPANVFDASDGLTASDALVVRNVGCGDTDPTAACPSPGAPTAIEVLAGATVGQVSALDGSQATVDGATVGSSLTTFGTASITLLAGTVGNSLVSTDASTITMSGGAVALSLTPIDDSVLTWRGGSVNGTIQPADGSILYVVGTGFSVGGNAVPYGPLVPTAGVLRGTLESGDPIAIQFFHAGFNSKLTGTIILAAPVPEPAGLVLCLVGLCGVAVLGGRRRGD